MKANEPIPSSQFERCTEALRGLTLLVEEMTSGLELARNEHAFEAQRNLTLCANHIEDAKHRLDLALKAMLRRKGD